MLFHKKNIYIVIKNITLQYYLKYAKIKMKNQTKNKIKNRKFFLVFFLGSPLTSYSLGGVMYFLFLSWLDGLTRRCACGAGVASPPLHPT